MINQVLLAKKVSVKSQRGQLVVEAILLMVVLLAIAGLATKYLANSQLAQKLTIEPWGKLAGMIECGSWQQCQGGIGVHPSSINRTLSLRIEPNE